MEKFYSLISFSSTAPSAKCNIQFAAKSFLFAICLLVGTSIMAQPLTGTKTIPGNYATIALAVTDLNTQGVGAGGVTFSVTAGHTETLSAVISITATGTMANPILFQKNGVGANPLITAYTGGTALHTTTAAPHDGLVRLVGADYVTFDGIDLTENGANSGGAMMEYGYALLKASGTDGCQNNTIRNCTITLNRTNATTGTVVEADNGATGIWVANTLATGNATVTVTAASGSNSNNVFYSNTIQNCNTGIYIRGFNDATPYALYDQNNDIGGADPSTGNTIINYGGGGVAVTAHAIRAIYQNGFNFSFNTINSNNGSGVNHTSTLRGIFMSTGTSSSGTISDNTVTLSGGGTSSSLTAIENAAGSTPAGNTISMNNNTIENSTYTTATSGTFTGLINNGVPETCNMDNNTINNNTIPGTGSMTLIDGGGGTGSTINITSNFVTNNSKTGASGSLFCIRAGGGTTVMTGNSVHDNGITNNSGTSTSNLYGLYNITTTANQVETYSGNEIYNLSISGATTSSTGVINGIHSVTVSSSTKTISENSIYNLQFSNSSTGSIVITGINHTTANSVDIFKNRIYGLTATNGASSTVLGITNGTSVTTCNINNNLIGNLSASAASGADMVKGINITNATAPGTNNVSFNTVYLNATSSGTNFGTSGIYHTTNTTASTGMLVLRSNIIVNTSTPNGTGFTAAYRRSSATLTNYGSASNNNLFYAGTPSASRLIFYDGTNSDQTIAAYKSRVTPRDAASVSENPDFLSTTGSSSDFLHIDPATATQIESGGITVSGITTDFDGQTRNVSTPDIGADEFAGIAVDLTLPLISYALWNNTNCTADRILSSTITDGSGINTTAGTKPRLYYKKSTNANTYAGNTNADDGWKYVEASNASSPFTFTTNFSLLQTPLSTGDIIQYFVVAQDLAGTPNVAINSGVFNTTPASVALVAGNFPITGTINSFTVVAAGLSGSYTIGAAGSYPNLTGATGLFNALNTNGIDGNITVTIVDGSIAETGTISLNEINNTNCNPGPFSVTIQPGAGVSATLTGSVSTPLINLNGADNITINGLNTGGSALTIRNTTTGGATIRLIADASNFTLQNTTLEGMITTSTAGVLFISTGTTTGNDNINITNNVIRDRSDAAGVPANLIYSSGTSSSITNGSVTLTGNTLKNYTNTAISLAGTGASNGNENWTISGNTIFQEAARTTAVRGMNLNFLGTNVVTENIIRDLTTSSTVIGVLLTDTRNTTVSKNRIYNIPSTSGSTSDLAGIQFDGVAGFPSSVTAANNMISIVPGFSNNQEIRGIYDFALTGNTFTAYYNSIYIGGTNSGTNDSWAIIRGILAPTDFTAQNNIALNTRTGGGGSHFAIGDQSANTGTFNSNYNIFVGTGTTMAEFMDYGTSSTGTPVTSTTWQAGPPARDANSQFSNPGGAYTQAGMFVSETDLHAVLTSNPASNAGTPVAVTTDFDNQARSGSTPDIGADEFVAVVGSDVGILDLVAPAASGCYTATETVTVTLKNFSASTIDFSINNVTVNVTATGGYNSNIVLTSGTLAGNATQNVTVPATINLTVNGTYTFNSSATVAGDINNSNNAMPPAIRTVASLGGNYNVGVGQGMSGGFNTLTEAVGAYNAATCITSAVSFTLMDASYGSETFPIIINENSNASAVNNLTIKPNTGVAATISGTSGASTSALIKINGADYVTIDGLNSGGSSLTIENTSTTDGTAVIWIASIAAGAGAHDNTIANCTLKGGIAQNASTSDSYGILICGSTISGTPTSNSAGNDNDNNTVTGNNIYKVRYGMIVRGGATTNPNTGIVISENIIGPSAFGVDQVGKVGMVIREVDGIQITGNNIGFIGGNFANTTSGVDRVGIAFATDGTWTSPSSVLVKNALISNNTIHDVVDERTFSAVGIIVAGVDGSNPTNNVVANNMFYNIKSNGTSPDHTAGIAINAGNGDKIVYNTLNLTGDVDPDASASTPTVGGFGISIGSTSVTNPTIMDNIIVMDLTSSSAPSLENACINIPSSYAWGTGLSNYNDLYFPAGNAQSNTGSIGGTAGTVYLTLANWQAATTQDANSIYQEPIFTSPSNLHLSTTSNGSLDNLGSPVTGITTDFDNDTRHVTAPDMGADEFTTVIGLDMGAIALVAPVISGCFSGSETVTVTIKNFSVTTIDFAVDNVTVNASTTGPLVYSSNTTLTSGTLAPNATMDVVMPATIDMTANGTYVFALSTTVALDVNATNDAIMANRVVFDMAGSYNVGVGEGGSGGFESLTSAILAYNNSPCFHGPVTFVLTDATYTAPGETFPLIINANAAAGTNTLTIRPDAGTAVSIVGTSGASASALIKLNGADYVIIDGLNTGGASLTIENTSTTDGTAVIWIASLGADAGAHDNIIANCTLKGGIAQNGSTSDSYGILICGSTISSTPTSNSAGNDNDNNTVSGNHIYKVRYGMIVRGGATTNPNTGTVITDNLFGPSGFGVDQIGRAGLVIREEDGIQITGNDIGFIGGDHANTTGGADRVGLVFGTDAIWPPTAVFVKNAIITGNIIHDIIEEREFSSIGIGVGAVDDVNPTNNLFANNVIYNVKANATSGDIGIGLGISESNTDEFVFNSIYMYGDTDPTGAATTPTISSYGVYIEDVTVVNPTLKNNSVFMDLFSSNALTLKNAAIFIPAAYTWGTGSSDYNNFYISPSNTQSAIGFIGTTIRESLVLWQSATSQDGNSISADPLYNSAVNLLPYTGSPLVGAGTTIVGITTDIEGDTRNVSTPTIGAYELTSDVSGPAISYTPISNTLCTSSIALSVSVNDFSSVNTTAGTKPRLYYKKSTDANIYAGNTSGNNGWKYVEASNASSPFLFNMNFSLLQSTVIAGDIIQYFVVAQDLYTPVNVGIQSGTFAATPTSVDLTSLAFPIGGSINSYTITAGGLASNVTIGGAGTYPSLSGTGGLFAAINASGLLNNITATILDATIIETGANPLNEIRTDCGGPYTLTIKPGAGVTTVLSGSAASPLIDLSGADNVVIDGSNNGTSTLDMTVRNTSTSGAAVRFINGASSNSIHNVKFESPVSSASNGVVVFSTTTTGSGNNNNTISNCHIRDRSDATGVPANAVYSSGSNANTGNTITASNIFNFSQTGINLTAVAIGDNWTISDNNIYNAQATPSASTQNGILIAGGTGHSITGNFVGGSGVGATGTWTNTGNVVLQGISITGGSSTVSGNTVANFSATNVGTTAKVRGIAASSAASSTTISDNSVHDLSSSGAGTGIALDLAVVVGIYSFTTGTQNIVINNNTVYNLSCENTSALTTSNVVAGIGLSNYGGITANNTIHSIENHTTGSTANQPPIAAGIFTRTLNNGFVVNNMISIGVSETTNTQFNGIFTTGTVSGQHYYYFNSVSIGGTTTGSWGSNAYLRGDNSTTSVTHPVILKNNIFSMERTGGTSVNYAIANQGTTAATGWSSDYNDLHNVTSANIGYWNATGYDFANWQTTSLGDANSVSVAPVFVGPLDLHLTVANTGLDNEGTPIAGITTDFDGAVRNILTPDIGAHEIITSGCSKFITSGADSGAGSLRAAVACAQSGEQLIIDPSVPAITLTTGEIVLGKTLIITGHGVMDVLISGNGNSRIFNLQPTYFLQLEDMSLIAATAPMNGGAFWAQGNMVLKNLRIDSCDEGGIPKVFTITPGINIQFMGDNELND